MKDILPWLWDETLLQGLVHELHLIPLLGVMVVCIVVLSKGADWMVDGVVNMARRTGLPKIVIGATIVSLGTTTPEAVVSVMAAWMGNSGLALGNGVGSIIADTGLIFGVTALLITVPVNRFILNRTGWVQVGSATLLVVISVIALGMTEGIPILGRWVGLLFLVLLCAYMYVTYVWARQGPKTTLLGEEEEKSDQAGLAKCLLMILGGVFLVVLGARVLVPCAAEIAYRIGVPEDIIATTMVALGTSLPELMTAIAAIRKRHPEIMLGNVVGADVLNCLFVIGAAAVAKPLAVLPNFFSFHFPTMILILYSFRVFIFINKDGFFKKWQGAWLLVVYLAYIILQYAFNVGTVEG